MFVVDDFGPNHPLVEMIEPIQTKQRILSSVLNFNYRDPRWSLLDLFHFRIKGEARRWRQSPPQTEWCGHGPDFPFKKFISHEHLWWAVRRESTDPWWYQFPPLRGPCDCTLYNLLVEHYVLLMPDPSTSQRWWFRGITIATPTLVQRIWMIRRHLRDSICAQLNNGRPPR